MKSNIILTGFMGTGKSTVGKVVASKLQMQFIDTDAVIERQEGMTISDIFSTFGEKHFRDIESKVIEQTSKLKNSVVATGGGVVLNPGNIENLRHDGIIIYFQSNVDTIIRNTSGSDHRPLLQRDDMRKNVGLMLQQREQYYRNNDFSIDVSDLSVEQTVQKVIEIYESSKG